MTIFVSNSNCCFIHLLIIFVSWDVCQQIISKTAKDTSFLSKNSVCICYMYPLFFKENIIVFMLLFCVFNFFKFSVVLYRMILLLNTFCKGNVDKGQKLCYLRNCFMKSINQQFSLCVCTFSKLRLHIINISMVLVYLFPMLTAYGYVVNIRKAELTYS